MKLLAHLIFAAFRRSFIIRLAAPGLILLLALDTAWAQSPPTITKSFSAASVPLNGSVTLTFTITNPNPATDLTGINLNDNLPPGLIIANPDSLVGNCDPGVITTMVNSISLVGAVLLANTSCTFSIDVLAVSGGTQVNTTDPISSVEGGTGGTATATVDVMLPDLAIAKTHTGNFRQGQVGAAYTITVSEVGGVDTTDPVTVTDTLPAALTATNIGGSGWICSPLPTLSCMRSDALSAGTSFPDITVTVNVAPGAPATVTNTATVSGGGEGNTSNDTATDPTTVDQVADLTITKTHAGNFLLGQTGATYTLTVHNGGPGPTIGAVSVTDILPAVPNTLVATAMSGTGWSCTLGALTCMRSDALPAGGNYPAITLTVNVPNNIQASVTNSATVAGGGELNTSNDSASDPTNIAAPIRLTPQSTNLQVIAGQSVSTIINVDSSSGVGTITFACGGLPAGVTCSFNPASVNQLSAQVTLTIATTKGVSSLLLPGVRGIPPADLVALLSLLALMASVIAGKKNRKFRMRLAGGLAALMLLGLAGCGGKPRTGPAQTFPVSINATSTGGFSGSTTVNLTVQ